MTIDRYEGIFDDNGNLITTYIEGRWTMPEEQEEYGFDRDEEKILEEIDRVAVELKELLGLAANSGFMRKFYRRYPKRILSELQIIGSGLTFLRSAIQNESLIFGALLKRFLKREK